MTANIKLKQGDKTYTPVFVNNVIYWCDESFRNSANLVKGDGLLFSRDNEDYELYYYEAEDGFGLGVLDLNNQRCTISRTRCCLIKAQSKPILRNMPVVNIDNFYTQENVEQISSIPVIEIDKEFNIINQN